MKRLILAVSIGFLIGWFAKDTTGAEDVRAAAQKAPSYMVRALQGSNVEVLEIASTHNLRTAGDFTVFRVAC